VKFEKSADAKVIESVLIEMKVGDMVTYETISSAIGRDVRVFARGALNTARRSLLKSNQMVFDCENGIGIKRLDDGQIVSSTEADRKSLLRKANRTIDKLACVEFEKLSIEQKRKHTAAASQMGVVAMFSSSSAAKKIESKIKDNKQLAIGETLNFFVSPK
jgi:hypothetical protein